MRFHIKSSSYYHYACTLFVLCLFITTDIVHLQQSFYNNIHYLVAKLG